MSETSIPNAPRTLIALNLICLLFLFLLLKNDVNKKAIRFKSTQQHRWFLFDSSNGLPKMEIRYTSDYLIVKKPQYSLWFKRYQTVSSFEFKTGLSSYPCPSKLAFGQKLILFFSRNRFQ